MNSETFLSLTVTTKPQQIRAHKYTYSDTLHWYVYVGIIIADVLSRFSLYMSMHLCCIHVKVVFLFSFCLSHRFVMSVQTNEENPVSLSLSRFSLFSPRSQFSLSLSFAPYWLSFSITVTIFFFVNCLKIISNIDFLSMHHQLNLET